MPTDALSSAPAETRPRGLALAVFLACLAATLGLYFWDRQGQRLQDEIRIQRYAERVEAAIRNRIGRYEDIVRGAQGFLAQEGTVSEAQWHDYVDHLDLPNRHPGLSSLAFIAPVASGDLEAYLKAHPQLEGRYHTPKTDPAYLVDPSENDPHLIIELCEPQAQSPGALGLDVGASRTQRLTAEHARDSGGPALTGLLYFSHGEAHREATALFLPVYRTQEVPPPEERAQALRGWVTAGILLQPMIEDVLRREDPGLALSVVDTYASPDPRWLYVSPRWPEGARPVAVHDLDIEGRGWQFRYAVLDTFTRTSDHHRPEWILLAGLVVSASLAAGMASLTGTRARAIQLARGMTESLHQALARNRSHLENSPLAVIETDAAFCIREWNPAAERLFGYPRAEMLGRDPRMLVPEDGQAALIQRRQDLAEGHAEGTRVSLGVLCATGDIRLCDWYITALRDEAGRFAGAMFLGDDVTERRKAEEAVRQSQKLESLGVLAGGIAHDFNNLLTAVLGNTEVALTQLPAGSPLQPPLERIDTAARRGADLARQLLAYAGKGHFSVRPQDLNRIIREMGDLLAVSISKKVTLQYDLQPELPPVEADSAQFQQVVMNLVINASEAIGDRSGTVTLRTRAVHRDAARLAEDFPGQSLEPGAFVEMEVEDDGCGMDPVILDRIFDPFFSTKFTGRGLGLSAMLGIVRGHRAGIHVTSAPEQGTTFTLLFPASERPLPQDPEHPKPGASVRGTVLVVDDEDIIRDLARAALTGAGLEVLEARDGQEAVEAFLAQAGRVDLVLLDMTMPRMGGAEAFRLIRQADPRARVLLTSGYTQQESLDALTDLVPDGFLQKPFRVRDLVARVQDVMASRPPELDA